jgi:hypothetical protein
MLTNTEMPLTPELVRDLREVVRRGATLTWRERLLEATTAPWWLFAHLQRMKDAERAAGVLAAGVCQRCELTLNHETVVLHARNTDEEEDPQGEHVIMICPDGKTSTIVAWFQPGRGHYFDEDLFGPSPWELLHNAHALPSHWRWYGIPSAAGLHGMETSGAPIDVRNLGTVTWRSLQPFIDRRQIENQINRVALPLLHMLAEDGLAELEPWLDRLQSGAEN